MDIHQHDLPVVNLIYKETLSMKVREFLKEFGILFVLTFVVALAVSYVYQMFAYGSGSFEIGLAFRMALILAIVIPVSHNMDSKKQAKKQDRTAL